jgi:hypothetical protein
MERQASSTEQSVNGAKLSAGASNSGRIQNITAALGDKCGLLFLVCLYSGGLNID